MFYLTISLQESHKIVIFQKILQRSIMKEKKRIFSEFEDDFVETGGTPLIDLDPKGIQDMAKSIPPKIIPEKEVGEIAE